MIHFLGVNHVDPLGPFRLRGNLGSLVEVLGGRPLFVATEWAARTHSWIRSRGRQAIRELMDQQMREVPPALIPALTMTLGYEGDAFEGLLPASEILWLDDGDKAWDWQYAPFPEQEISELVDTRVRQFRAAVLTVQISVRTPARRALEKLSHYFWEGADEELFSISGRDRRWFEKLRARCSSLSAQDYAVVIVGFTHLFEKQPSVYSFCRRAGIPCRKRILCPSVG